MGGGASANAREHMSIMSMNIPDGYGALLDAYPGGEKMSMPSVSTGINVSQILTSVLKYLIEGLAIAIVAYAVPQKKLKLDEVATIALVGAATFAILDMYAPGATADAARMGAGFGIGGNLVGFA